MPEVRERKKSDKIKDGSGAKKSPIKKDVRRQMTVKLKKEMIERQRNRDTGGSTDTAPAPEVQAAEQVEEKIYTTADRIREHTGDAVSKSIARYRRKQQKKKQRTEPPANELPTADTEPAPPPARERTQQKAPADVRTRSVEAGHDPPAPLKERRTEQIRERPATPRPGRKGTTARTSSASLDTRSEIPRTGMTRTTEPVSYAVMEHTTATGIRPGLEYTPEAPRPKERMRQNAIKEKRDQYTEMRQKPAASEGRRTSAPVHERIISGEKAEPVIPKPQERMREKAVTDAQRSIGSHSRVEPTGAAPRLERPPAPKDAIESKSVSFGSQSINPIKESPRRSLALKEKPSGGAFIPKTRQTAAAMRSQVKTIPPVKKGKAAMRPLERIRQRVQRNAQRKLLQKSTRTTKAAVDLSRKVFAAIARATSSAVSALAGLIGGAVLIPVFCLIIFFAAFLASPFGILFANEPTPDAVPLNVVVGNLNMELSNQLELLQSGDYDSCDVQGQEPDWREVVAVFAVKTAGADNGVDVAVLTPDRVDRLRAVFWDMCAVTSEVETIDHPDSNPDDDTDDSWTERILHITITAKSADDMRTEYSFTDYQNEALTELLAELATVDILLTDLSAIEGQARELLQRLPADLSPERRAVVETACRLVGKVNYFWGGKSLVIGWDSRWGTMQKVWAAGSPSTGTYRPYGMDCSGFVDWVFYNMSGGSYVIGHGGGARMQHSYCTPITWAEARPGDLVFYPEDTHVGIVGGWDENGNILIIHCASGHNNVVITGQAGFTTIGRPLYYSE